MGTRGRDSVPFTILFVLVLVAAVSTQTSFSYQDVAADLGLRIAAVIPPGAQVSVAVTPENQPDDITPLHQELSALLMARGMRVVPAADGVVAIRLACLRNLRERSCSAEIRSGGARNIVMVTRPLDGRPPAEDRAPLSLALRPVFAQRAQILDVAIAGDRLFVLDVERLASYQRTAGTWQPVESWPWAADVVWPRDPRGRLQVERDRIDAWLPGFACTGGMAPLTLTCGARQLPWPIGIATRGLDAARNHFTTPEGLAFYSVTAVSDAAGGRWIVAGQDGALTWLDDARRAVGEAGIGGDVAGLDAVCGPGSTIVAVERARAPNGDALRMFQSVRGRLVPAGSPIQLTGTVTALWSMPGAETGTVVVHGRGAARYEAFQISIDCGR